MNIWQHPKDYYMIRRRTLLLTSITTDIAKLKFDYENTCPRNKRTIGATWSEGI